MGIGDWGLGIGPNPQSPIPNPQPPIPLILYKQLIIFKQRFNIYFINQIFIKFIIIIINFYIFNHKNISKIIYSLKNLFIIFSNIITTSLINKNHFFIQDIITFYFINKILKILFSIRVINYISFEFNQT